MTFLWRLSHETLTRDAAWTMCAADFAGIVRYTLKSMEKCILGTSLCSGRDCLREVRAAAPRRGMGRSSLKFAYAARCRGIIPRGLRRSLSLPSHTIPPATQATVGYFL